MAVVFPLVKDLSTKRGYRFFLPGTDTLPGGSAIPATQIGQVLYSVDGLTFTAELPVTSDHGWLVNNDGILIVNG